MPDERNDEPRFWILEDANPHNKIEEASEAIGFPVVGLVDEECGGVIAYMHVDRAEELIACLP